MRAAGPVEARTIHRSAAWRLIAGGALALFSAGTVLGHVWTDEPEPTVVWFERAHTPQEAP